VIACGAAACGGGSSSYVAKVGTKPVTKAQLQALMATAQRQYRAKAIAFPARGTAEYRLLQEQALDFLTQQTLAHLVDAKLGIAPENRVVTDASFRKVTGSIHAGDPDRLRKRRGTAMHRFVRDAERRWPITYLPGYERASEMVLARRVWKPAPRGRCDLPAGNYPYEKARAHGCVSGADLLPGRGSPVCSLIDLPLGPNGFTSAEENDGFAQYLEDNGGTCVPDPRSEPYQVRPQPDTSPTTVSYLPRSGVAMYTDKDAGWTLRYPRRFHTLRIDAHGPLSRASAIVIANFRPTRDDSQRQLTSRAVELSFGEGQSALPHTPSPHDTRLPLTLADFRSSSQLVVQAGGDDFFASILVGSKPSVADRAALEQMLASIHFPPLRIGHFAWSGLYVLGRASSFPLGSVLRIPGGIPLPNPPNPGQAERSGPFYLVHEKDGFWELAWSNSVCGVHFDSRHRLFRCTDGSAWNVRGRITGKHNVAAYADDQPFVSPAPVSSDGYVLVNVSVTG